MPSILQRGEVSALWKRDDSPKPQTKDEIIESLEDELRRWSAACEYWKLCYERAEAKKKELQGAQK